MQIQHFTNGERERGVGHFDGLDDHPVLYLLLSMIVVEEWAQTLCLSTYRVYKALHFLHQTIYEG